MRVFVLLCTAWLGTSIAEAQPPAPGQPVFVSRCAGCHGSDGNGGELGPAITTRVPTRSDQDLTTTIRDGIPAAGMPAFGSLTTTESADLVRYLRTLKPRNGSGPARTKVTLADGRALEGLVLNQSLTDLQLLGDGRKLHSRRTTSGITTPRSRRRW